MIKLSYTLFIASSLPRLQENSEDPERTFAERKIQIYLMLAHMLRSNIIDIGRKKGYGSMIRKVKRSFKENMSSTDRPNVRHFVLEAY